MIESVDGLIDAAFHGLQIDVCHDPGVYRTPNGDGCPPTIEVEVSPVNRWFSVFPDVADGISVGDTITRELAATSYNGGNVPVGAEGPTVEITATCAEMFRFTDRVDVRFILQEAL